MTATKCPWDTNARYQLQHENMTHGHSMAHESKTHTHKRVFVVPSFVRVSSKTHASENIIENKITLTSKKIDIPAKVALVDVLTWLTFPIDLYFFAISATLSGLRPFMSLSTIAR